MEAQKKNNILLVLLCVFLSTVISSCIIAFSGILSGEKGDRGVTGEDGATIFVTSEYLSGLWEENINGVRATYNDDFANFYVNYPKDNGLVITPAVDNKYDILRASRSALKSTVDIITVFKTVDGIRMQLGAGVLYDLSQENGAIVGGYIITNYHVISEYTSGSGLVASGQVYIRLFDAPSTISAKTTGTKIDYTTVTTEIMYDCIPAHVVGGSDGYDVAILEFKCDEKAKQLEFVDTEISGTTKSQMDVHDNRMAGMEKVGDIFNSRLATNSVAKITVNQGMYTYGTEGGDEIIAGTPIFIVGNPLGEKASITEGIVSVKSEYSSLPPLDQKRIDYDLNRVMRISADINQGNSGGGAFDLNGEMIGIVQSKDFWDGSFPSVYDDDRFPVPVDGVGYVIPVGIVKRIADQVIDAHRDYSGYNYQNPYIIRKHSCSLQIEIEKYTLDENVNRIETIRATITGKDDITTDKEITVKNIIVKGVYVKYENGTEKYYAITRSYQIDEIMIQAYGRTIAFENESGQKFVFKH